MRSLEALNYLNDIAHGRKMDLDPQELKNAVEKELYAIIIIKKYCQFDFDTGDLIVSVPSTKEGDKEYDFLTEVLANV